MPRIKLCRHCGSNDLQYEFHTPSGKREVYRCLDCGNETFFRVDLTTLQEIQDENTIYLYTVWGKEDPQ